MRRTALSLALVVSVLASALPRLALAQVAGGDVGGSVVTFGAWDWLNLVVRLAAVVAIIWGVFWALRWYNRRIQTGTGASRSLQILETRTLGPSRSLQLVRVGHRAVLVGVTADRINQLLEIDDPEEVERLAEAAAAAQGQGPALARVAGTLTRLASAGREPRGRQRAALATAPSPPVGDGTMPPVSPSAQQVQASAAYRGARIAELQRAIEDARRGTSFERIS